MRRWWLVIAALWWGGAAIGIAVSADDAAPVLEERSNAQQERESRFTPTARRFLDLAKERIEAERRAKTARELDQQRQAAQRLAIQVSREKLKREALHQRDTQRQLQLARERRLKSLYQRALALYQAGDYEEAAETLQQMVVLDPRHPLVKAADRLIAKAELKRFEDQVRASARLPVKSRGAIVPELEQLLTQKRMELETVLKYAKSEIQSRNYDAAEKLLTAILVQDPSQRQAQQLLEQVKLAKLADERGHLTHDVEHGEQSMLNDVLKAQVLPPEIREALAAGPGRAKPLNTVSAKLQQPVSFEFTDVPLGDVVDFISDAANVSIIPSPQLDLKSRRVSLKINQLPLEQAIKYLTKSLSLSYRLEPDAIVIATPEEFSNEPLQTRVFFLHNGLGPFALTTSAVEPNPVLAMESIKKLMERSIPDVAGSRLVIDERTGALIVTNTAEHLELVERLLGQLDVTPTQVLIEARFIELTATDLEHVGLESVLNGDVAFNKKGVTTASGAESEGHGNQIAKNSGFKFPALARESEGVNLTLQGVLSGTQLETVLHLLEESKKSKTLSAPRVTTLNNQTASIRVVEEFNYPTRYEVSLIQFDINGDGDFDDAGETEFANVPKDLQKRDIGILLNVTPSVGKDLHTITLVLAPEVSAFSQFKDLGGGVTVPEFTSSQLTTSVVIADGETVVLGGLMKDTTETELTKVPVLGDIPILGGLFRQKEESITRKNLLIFITARLLVSRGQTT